jgi:hypothetical protein
MWESADRLARCNVGVMVPVSGVVAASYHVTAVELTARVLNNARTVAGYSSIFPSAQHPGGIPLFHEICHRYPRVLECVDEQGWEEIGLRWDEVRQNLSQVYPLYLSGVLCALIQKESAQLGTAEPPQPRLRVEEDSVFLDDDRIPLDMTEESRGAARCYLRHLLAAGGEWRSDSEVDEMEGGSTCAVKHVGVRWDRIRKQLPNVLKALIQTDRKKGSRLADPVWRR